MLKITTIATAASLTMVPFGVVQASSLTILAEFTGANGAYPRTGLVFDTAGKLYGSTTALGKFGAGTVFSLTPPSGSVKAWSAATLFSFANGGDPNYLGPQGGKLTRDSGGHLYATTYGVDCNLTGKRTAAFRLTPPSGGSSWTAQRLFDFAVSDGSPASGGLLLAENGTLYGTTVCGGAKGHGTVYRLVPPNATSGWTKAKLLDFDGATGRQPRGAGLVSDAAGNLYGTTAYGGSKDRGTVFKLTRPTSPSGKWVRTTLVNFDGSNGMAPSGGLITDASGNLYGVTWSGGSTGYGTVFRLMPPLAGTTSWRFKTLVSFDRPTGFAPLGSLTIDPAGNLYGALRQGGTNCSVPGGTSGCGAIFQLKPSSGSATGWSRSTLVLFNGKNGALPNGDLTVGSNGKLYGTTYSGGAKNYGTAFELKP